MTEDVLCSHVGAALFERMKPEFRKILEAVFNHSFQEVEENADGIRDTIGTSKNGVYGDDGVLRDLYVLGRYVDFLTSYAGLWRLLVGGEYGASWTVLQDTLDTLRVIKRFSSLDILFFEDQLVDLEQAYPYKVFASIGVSVDHFECSICGQDINSDDCMHRRGELYNGTMACAIARSITEVDHVALVTDPEDKRCVISLDDSSPQFYLVRYIADLIASRELRISDFARLEWTKRRKPNPDYVELGRNERCFCGSGQKFKLCCIDKREVEGDHVQVITLARRDLPSIIV